MKDSAVYLSKLRRKSHYINLRNVVNGFFYMWLAACLLATYIGVWIAYSPGGSALHAFILICAALGASVLGIAFKHIFLLLIDMVDVSVDISTALRPVAEEMAHLVKARARILEEPPAAAAPIAQGAAGPMGALRIGDINRPTPQLVETPSPDPANAPGIPLQKEQSENTEPPTSESPCPACGTPFSVSESICPGCNSYVFRERQPQSARGQTGVPRS